MEKEPIMTIEGREIFEHDLSTVSRPVVEELVGVLNEKQALLNEAQEAAKKVNHFNSLIRNENLLIEKLRPMLPELPEENEEPKIIAKTASKKED
mgnify:FL=1